MVGEVGLLLSLVCAFGLRTNCSCGVWLLGMSVGCADAMALVDSKDELVW